MSFGVSSSQDVQYLHSNLVVAPCIAEDIEAKHVIMDDTDIQAQHIVCDTADCETLFTSNLNANAIQCNTATISVLNSTSIDAGTLSIDSITVPNINVQTVNVQDANGTTLFSNTITSDSTTGTTASVTNIETEQLNVTNTVTTNSFVYNETGTDMYLVDQQATYRGVTFFRDLDVGIGDDPNTTISAQIKAQNGNGYIQGFNRFINAIDSGTDYGGETAVLSLSSNTAPYRTLRFQEDGNLVIYSDTSTALWTSGTGVSDARLKENITPIRDAMNILLQIHGIYYEYKDNLFPGRFAGVIAQEVEKVYPYCVKTIGNTKLVHLEKLVPLMIEGFKELEQRAQIIREALSPKSQPH